MITPQFDEDRRYCPCCDDYVSFLSSPDASYCVECGGKVKVLSPQDLAWVRDAPRTPGDARRSWNDDNNEAEPRAVS